MIEAYKRQVSLVLDVLPEIAKEECFALHGGTAINLFLRNMPRLSIDIDLTYVPIADRESSFAEIGSKLVDIENRVKKVRSDIITSLQRKDLKLFISHNGALIKIAEDFDIPVPTNRQLVAKVKEIESNYNDFT